MTGSERGVGSGGADERGSLERVTDETSWPAALGAVGLGAGVAGVAAGAYAKRRGRSGERSDDAQNE